MNVILSDEQIESAMTNANYTFRKTQPYGHDEEDADCQWRAIAIAQARHLLKLLQEPCLGHPTVNKDGKTIYYGGKTKGECRLCLKEIEKEIGE